MTQTVFPDTTVLDSSALTPRQVEDAFQILTTRMLGIASQLTMECTLTTGSFVITTPLVTVNLQLGFYVTGNGIPLGTTITAITAQDTNFLITLSKQATVSGDQWLEFYDPQANTKVRPAWQTEGMPAFGIDDDVVFLRIVEEVTEYSDIRDQRYELMFQGEGIQYRTYSRLWNVFFRARGPNSFDSVRLIKSMLLQDSAHDMLASLKLYLTGIQGTPIRVPELFEGRWWEQVDFTADFMEQVDESFTFTTVAGVEIIGSTNDGDSFDVKAEIK